MSTPASDISSLLDQLREQWLEVVKERDELRNFLRDALHYSTHAVSCPSLKWMKLYCDSADALEVCDCWRKNALKAIYQKGPSA